MSTTYIQVCSECGHAEPVYTWGTDRLCRECIDKAFAATPPTRRLDPDECQWCDKSRDPNCPYCRGGRGIL